MPTVVILVALLAVNGFAGWYWSPRRRRHRQLARAHRHELTEAHRRADVAMLRAARQRRLDATPNPDQPEG